MAERLHLSAIGASFDDGPVIGPFDVAFDRGDLTLLAGASGAGKSTLARLACGLQAASMGSRSLDGGEPLQGLSRDIQFIFQNPFEALNPTRRIGGLVEAPFRNFERLTEDDVATNTEKLAHRLLLSPWSEFRNRFPHQLSGGQRQRVLIARALAAQPSFLFADEPTAMLDQSLKRNVYGLFRSLAKDLNVGIVIITHDLLGAESFSDRIIVVDKGRIVDDFQTQAESVELSAESAKLVKAALFPAPEPGDVHAL